MRGAALFIFLVAMCVACPAQKLLFSPEDKSRILERMENPPASDADRAARIRAMFAEAGCSGNLLQEQPVSGAVLPNIVCELPGQSEASVIVGAHYDLSTSAARPLDNWSGASLLPAIYRSLRDHKRNHTFIFVAFADKGSDLSGAESFAGHMSASQLRRTEAMVNLDVLGLSPTKVSPSHSDKDLVHDLVVMVYTLKLPASQIDMETAGPADSEPFAFRHVPRITLHSLTRPVLDGLPAQFRPNNYYDTYRLICGYLAYLDANLKPRAHPE
jgi:hypothetical protein